MHVLADCSSIAWQRIANLNIDSDRGDSCASDGATVVSYPTFATSPARRLAARRIVDMFLVPFFHRHLSSYVTNVVQGQ